MVEDLINQLINIAAKNPDNLRTDEIRNFINANSHVGDFRKLAITLLLLGENYDPEIETRDQGSVS